ncbi:MAG TPA: sensor domain-containing diguanylate cyclase, partial [Gemmatimonadaceae bacterium]|nr:sensor domain-containing diguanylate cyclase [Gemmatimonadaceae bacterium]
ATEVLSTRLAHVLKVPLAILSKDPLRWRFEAQAFPDLPWPAPLTKVEQSGSEDDPVRQLEEDSDHAWTAVSLGALGDRDWALLLPGQSGTWASRPGFEELVEEIGGGLGHVASREQTDYASRFQRRLHAFTHRLAREHDPARLYSLVLRTLAAQVQAQTGALAVFSAAEEALAIVATHGYPLPIVEHLRIRSGEGVLGRVYASGKPMVGDAPSDGTRRLRYRTDSYIALPVMEGSHPLAVIALTDRQDGRPFDSRDFAAARMLASTAAAAFTRERLRERVEELTKVATVDSVTGLFNRRYVETRITAEIERAKRQQQDLAILLIDIDDFKRVNDTRGHLEGDRTLREVADLLRAGVRIFDVCARFGGEEFVIVMPAASVTVAQQIAERIRVRIERSFSHESPPVTVSIGVGMLGDHSNGHELVEVADRALIAAKRAGKNLVLTGGDEVAGPGR